MPIKFFCIIAPLTFSWEVLVAQIRLKLIKMAGITEDKMLSMP
jgi:hypothetical protein